MEFDYCHSLGTEEACERVRALTDYLANRHGMQVQWTGPDTAEVRGKYTVVTIEANVRVEQGRVHVQGKDPGVLWRGPAKKYITGKLEKYLNSKKPLEQLPRR